jgi:hypothetical protein
VERSVLVPPSALWTGSRSPLCLVPRHLPREGRWRKSELARSEGGTTRIHLGCAFEAMGSRSVERFGFPPLDLVPRPISPAKVGGEKDQILDTADDERRSILDPTSGCFLPSRRGVRRRRPLREPDLDEYRPGRSRLRRTRGLGPKPRLWRVCVRS